MSSDRETDEAPPPFGADDDDTKNDDPMFVSAIAPGTVDVSLSGPDDDDDDNPFGAAPPPPTAPRQQPSTNTVESYDADEKNKLQQDTPTVNLDDDDDVFGEKKKNKTASPSSVPAQLPLTASKSPPSTPIKQENQPTDFNASSSPSPRQSTTLASQISSSTPLSKDNSDETATASKPVKKRSSEDTIEITVGDPTKVGDGMSSYMTFPITTKTTLSVFKKPEFTVNRRFSDFLGLHTKLVQKHLHLGVIIPSPPEKDAMSMAKVKISKEEAISTDFLDRRRALLERYLNRLVRHDKLLEDTDLQEFLELSNDLPKSKDTQALSGAGILRALTNISSTVSKLTAKTSEQDQWFEEKHKIMVDLQTHLKHVSNQFNTLFSQRKEAGHALKQFSTSLNHLATTEEHPSLSSALTELANLKEKIDQINNEHCLKEYSILTELIKEYISLIDMIHLVFHERVKIHHQWLIAEETLKKNRERKTKLEQTPKGADKIPQAELDIRDSEVKVEQNKEAFERISTAIKEEMDAFEQIRVDDFKKAINNYLNDLLEQQEKILQIWEGYLPSANQINI